MMDYKLNRALTQIDDRYLTMADQTIKEVQTMRQKHFSTRKLFRTMLIAAVITALLGITAYAIGSIHATRQQALRTELQIEENRVSGYTEYMESETETALISPPEIDAAAAPADSTPQADFFLAAGGSPDDLFQRLSSAGGDGAQLLF